MRRGLLLVAAGGAAVVLSGTATGVPMTSAERAPGRTGEDGFALLQQAAQAATSLSYHGTQMASFWSDGGATSALIEVAHVGNEGLLIRVAPTPQNPGGAVYHDENGTVPEVVGFAKGTLALLARHFRAVVEGTAEVAGRVADVVAVGRPGESPSARFWLDRATRLPLRREVLDGGGRTVRESAFIDLVVGRTSVARSVQEAARFAPKPVGAPVGLTDIDGMRRFGWYVPGRVPAGLDLFEARMIGNGASGTLQLSYSDGVSTVSVFEQRGRLDTRSVAGWERADVGGARVWVQAAFPRRVVWSGGGTVFTVVADSPQATLDAVVSALPHRNRKPGLGARLGRGLSRVGSWLNPFA